MEISSIIVSGADAGEAKKVPPPQIEASTVL